MTAFPLVRPVESRDHAQWRPLWDGYNAFYGRSGPTALDERITARTWEWFFDPAVPVHALVAELEGRIAGIVHYLYHHSTSRMAQVCYLQDLFTDEACRGRGVGRALMQGVFDRARAAGSSRVYWTTFADNAPGRALYDKMTDYRGAIQYAHEL